MGIIDDIKSVGKVVQQIDNIELYQKILDLQAQALELVEENIVLKSELRKLQDTKEIGESLTFQMNVYWRNLSNGTKDGPFCSSCWDKDKSLVRLHEVVNWECRGCPSCRQVLNNDGSMPNPNIVDGYNIGRTNARRSR